MGFISNKERKRKIKSVNQNYGFRKILIAVEMAALMAYIAMIFVYGFKVSSSDASIVSKWKWLDDANKITATGWVYLILGIIVAIFGVVCLVLILTIKSPKTTQKELNKLQSSALSGKRVSAKDTNVKTNKSRTTIEEE